MEDVVKLQLVVYIIQEDICANGTDAFDLIVCSGAETDRGGSRSIEGRGSTVSGHMIRPSSVSYTRRR